MKNFKFIFFETNFPNLWKCLLKNCQRYCFEIEHVYRKDVFLTPKLVK